MTTLFTKEKKKLHTFEQYFMHAYTHEYMHTV